MMIIPFFLSVPKISVVVDKYTIYCVPYDLPYKIVFLFALQLQHLLLWRESSASSTPRVRIRRN